MKTYRHNRTHRVLPHLASGKAVVSVSFYGANSMKTCTKCKRNLPETKYHKDKSRKDGMQYTCKRCQSNLKMAWEKDHPARCRATWQKYNAAHRSEVNERCRKYRASRQLEIAEYNRRRYPLYKKEIAAVSRANYAKSIGILVPQPCTACGSTRNIDGHHDDYNKPLEVRWLCRLCHGRLHAELRRKA